MEIGRSAGCPVRAAPLNYRDGVEGDQATNEPPVVGGRYELGPLLGRGGMASVHRAVDRRLGRPVAVKRLSTALAADATAQTRFQREAHAAASLNHPAVAAVFDTGRDVDPTTGVSIPFLVMELVEGRTLRAVQTEGPRLTPERALEVVSQVLAALAHSHQSGLVHRDIKPANVMLTPTGAVKVMDFGIARAADDTASSLTGPAAVVGTAQYLSPEQARGEHVDARSDLYSTGCLLYELLLGRPPFTGESSVSLAYQHVNEDPVPLREVDPSLSPEVEAVVMKALAKDPADRYASADAMRADIDRLLEQHRVHALPAAAATVPVVARVGAGAEDEPTALIDAPTGALARTAPAGTMAGASAPMVVPVEPVPDPSPEEPPRRRRRTAVLVTVLVLVLLAGAAALGLPRLFGSDPSTTRTISVPNVLGQSRADADTALRNAGLVPRFTNVSGKDDDTLDHVVGQNPPSGREVETGSTVDLEVNVGPDSARIPGGLIGRDRDDAEKRLADAGFEKVSTTKAASQPDGAKEGEVLGVQPGEGELARQDQKVVLVLARARPRSAATSRQTTAPAPTEPTRSADSPAPSDEPSSSSEPSDEPSADPSPSGADEPSGSASSGSGDPSETPKGKAKGQDKDKNKPKGAQDSGSSAKDASAKGLAKAGAPTAGANDQT